MKKIYHIMAILIVAVTFVSCTHNNGDIGEYFGTWKLETISVDGNTDSAYGGDIFWKFQTSVICMERVTELHDTENRWGTWAQIGSDVLRMDFTHHDDTHPEGSDMYSPFPETYIPNGVTDLTIMSMSGSSMVLGYTKDDGTVIKYNLKKW